MIRMIIAAAVIVAFLAAPDISFGEGEVAYNSVSGEKAKPSIGVNLETSEKINEILMRTPMARQFLDEPNLETFLPVPENWKKKHRRYRSDFLSRSSRRNERNDRA
mgnify:CR=1 FL=1